jgi:ABC-type proline/glycine betaine transport system permease subunit
MSSKNANIFSNLFKFISKKNRYNHGIIIPFLKSYHLLYKEDDISMHFDTNIIRKIHPSFMKQIKDTYQFTDLDIKHSNSHIIQFEVIIPLLFIYLIFISLSKFNSFLFRILTFISIFIIYYFLLFWKDICTSLSILILIFFITILLNWC